MSCGFPFQLILQPQGTESLISELPQRQFQALLARLDLMFSSALMRRRAALLVFGIGLGRSGLWMLLPELPRPRPAGLPFDRNGTEAAAAGRTRAVLSAEIGAISGVLWADAAFTGTDLSTSLDRTNSGQLARARANADTDLLDPWRLERAATSSALADKDLQAFIKSEIHGIGQQR